MNEEAAKEILGELRWLNRNIAALYRMSPSGTVPEDFWQNKVDERMVKIGLLLGLKLKEPP